MSSLRTLTFVTGNAKKLEEVSSILQGTVNIVSHKLDCKYIERIRSGQDRLKLTSFSFLINSALASPFLVSMIVTEIQGTAEEVAKDKCRRAAEVVCA